MPASLFGVRELRNVGREVRRLREEALLTQARLGEVAGLSVGAVRELEGGRSNPTLGTIIAIVEALGTTIDALVAAARKQADLFEVTRAGDAAESGEHSLTRALPDPSMRASILDLDEGGKRDLGGGALFAQVLSGAVSAQINGDAYALGPGDSFHVQAEVGGMLLAGEGGGRVLLVTASNISQDQNRIGA